MTPTIHRIDPFTVTTLCGLEHDFHATALDVEVTCKACQRVLARRRRAHARQRAGLPPAGDLGSTGVEPE